MSQTNPANSAPTSSSTPGSEGSSSWVTFKPVLVPPTEGDWYHVEAWHKDDGPYGFMYRNERAWRQYSVGASTLEGVMGVYVDAKDVYAKVRIVKTTKTIITEDNLETK